MRGWGGGCCAVPRSQRREWSPIRVLQPVVGRPFHPGSGALNGVQLERVPRLSREVGEREMVKLARDCLAFVDVWRHRIQSPHRRPASRARPPMVSARTGGAVQSGAHNRRVGARCAAHASQRTHTRAGPQPRTPRAESQPRTAPRTAEATHPAAARHLMMPDQISTPPTTQPDMID